MNPFDQLFQEVENGIAGRNRSISMGFKRLNQYVGIRKKTMTLVFGPTGGGKSSLVDDAYILNPFDWWLENKGKTLIKPVPVLFSLERSKLYRITKWMSRRIYRVHGWDLPVGKILGWFPDIKLTDHEIDLIKSEADYLNELCEFCTIEEGAKNPTHYYRYMKEQIAEKRGKIEEVEDKKGRKHKIYRPDNEHEIVIPIYDHIGLVTVVEKGHTCKKDAIDKLVEYSQEQRDWLGMAPVLVAQINRELGSAMWNKNENIEPTIDQIKESGTPGEAADLIISVFDPIRYKTQHPDYTPADYVNEQTGAKCFRLVKLLKSTYSEDGIAIGMAFRGQQGMFKELPHKRDMTDDIPGKVISGEWFKDPEKRPETTRPHRFGQNT